MKQLFRVFSTLLLLIILQTFCLAQESDLDQKDKINQLEARISQLESRLKSQPISANGMDGYLSPQMYGAVAGDPFSDADAFQKMFDDAARRNKNVYVPPGEYKVDRTIIFNPLNGRSNKQLFHFIGYGANINHTGEEGYIFHFLRTKIEFNICVEGFRFVGGAKMNVHGLRVEGITQSSFRDMHFARCDRGFDYVIGWNNVLENMNFVNTGRSGFRGMAESGGGCKKGYNTNTHTNFRVQGGNWSWKQFKVMPESHFYLAGAGNVFQDFTTEGLRAQYGFVVDESGNCMNVNTIRNIHEESHAWSQTTDEVYYSLYIPLLRHRFDLYWTPQHGIKSDGDKLGQIIIHDSGIGGNLVSDKTGEATAHAIPRMTGISRGLHIYSHAHQGLTQEKYEAIVKSMGRKNKGPGKLRYRITCNGTLFYSPVSI